MAIRLILSHRAASKSRAIRTENHDVGRYPGHNLFGEMAIISDLPRSARTTAKEHCVYLVPRNVFEIELNGTSGLTRSLVRNLISLFAI